jgi:Ca-activated chloride channel family protein
VGRLEQDPVRRHRSRIAAALLALGALTALVALVDPHTGTRAPQIVLALDRSASIDPSMRATEGRWLAAVRTHSGCAAPCGVVRFAETADLIPASAGELLSRAGLRPGAPATDLERGIGAAVAAAAEGGRVVALSDGEQTLGDATGAVAAARARHITIDAVPLADVQLRDAALTRLDGPSAVRMGDTISLLVTVRSTVTAAARLAVRRDGGRPAVQTRVLQRGDNPLTLSYTAAAPGWHSFRVQVRMPGDRRPQNDTLSLSVEVGAAPRVVVVSSRAIPEIAGILRARDVPTTVEPASALPQTAAGYAGIDAVVLDDLPANRLATDQLSALTDAIRLGGLGLLTLGGRHAYSLGGYARSPLDRVLPLASLIPGDLQRRNLALELVLDRSGSMSDTSRGVPKIVMAQSAAKQAADFAHTHDDEFGVVAFDISPHVLLDLRRIGSSSLVAQVDARIGGLHADGGTDIFLGLRAGYRQILASGSSNRHIILLTDGISQPHTYTALLAQLKRHHITVATVALGTSVDSELLRRIAAATGGNSYETANARDLPRIFIKETRLSAKPVQIAGRQRVIARASSPIVRSLAGKTVPTLEGNVVTRLQVGAQEILRAKSGTATSDPALAEWGFGLGRVVSWTPGLGAPLAGAWSAETALWNDAARYVARGLPPPPVRASASEGTATRLEIDLGDLAPTERTTISGVLEGRGSSSRNVVLRETAPSRYTATVPARAPGSYGLTLDLAPGLGGRRRVLVDVPYPTEYLPTRTGRSTLAEVVTQAGGRLLPADPAATLSGATRSWRTLLLALALVLFLLSVATRLLVRSSRRPRAGVPAREQDERPREPPLTRR